MLNGIIAGAFDAIHPGYIYMFQKAREHCGLLTVALQTDPTVDRPHKLKPVLSYDERHAILSSIRYIDEIVSYTTEEELKNLLKTGIYNVRILGDDYVDKYATGQEYSERIVYIDRSHGWSTTKYKHLICESLKRSNK